eukprot:5210589-Pleurochrysis_carterae.AAC.2
MREKGVRDSADAERNPKKGKLLSARARVARALRPRFATAFRASTCVRRHSPGKLLARSKVPKCSAVVCGAVQARPTAIRIKLYQRSCLMGGPSADARTAAGTGAVVHGDARRQATRRAHAHADGHAQTFGTDASACMRAHPWEQAGVH